MRECHAHAPGRVNLIGEHTDYQQGYVMPSAIPQQTDVTIRTRDDQHVVAASAQAAGDDISYEVGTETRRGHWGDYIQAVTWVVRAIGLQVGGFELEITSTVPLGTGLSSSAALEVAALRAVRDAFSLPLSDIDLALAAHRAEVEFVGAPVGVMDQMATSLCGEREALFLDTRSLEYERIPFPAALELIVIDSGIAHHHAGGEYVTRRRESEEAARGLGLTSLREADAAALLRLPQLPALLMRRARHVVTENLRVLDAREALLAANVDAFGKLLTASHASLRDDYEVTVPEIDLLVQLAAAETDIMGARMTGGGFGGAIVAAALAGHGRAAAERICARFNEYGYIATVVMPTPTRTR